MRISRSRFVIVFVVAAFAFMFASNALLGSEARVFPWHDASFLGVDSPVAWKSAGYKLALPVKLVLVGPLLPFVDYVRQDPDPLPPFVAAVFALYWAALAFAIHFLVAKLMPPRKQE